MAAPDPEAPETPEDEAAEPSAAETRFDLAERLLGEMLKQLVDLFEKKPDEVTSRTFSEGVKLLAMYQRHHARDDSTKRVDPRVTEMLAGLPSFGPVQDDFSYSKGDLDADFSDDT